MESMADMEGSVPRPVTSIALWRGDRRPVRVVQESPVEQDLQQASQEGARGSLAFDAEYSLWLEELNKHINELRTAINSHANDLELRRIADNVIAHYNEVYRMKANAAKKDVFNVLSGMWKTPAERCLMWIGGFRPSELLKMTSTFSHMRAILLLFFYISHLGFPCIGLIKTVILIDQLLGDQLEPLTCQQFYGIHYLQMSTQRAEDSLSQGMVILEKSLGVTIANASPATEGSSNVATAIGALEVFEDFLYQADNLRQQMLQQMRSILTVRQLARALLEMNEYFSRLRALSSLWLARPREQ